MCDRFPFFGEQSLKPPLEHNLLEIELRSEFFEDPDGEAPLLDGIEKNACNASIICDKFAPSGLPMPPRVSLKQVTRRCN